MKIVELTTVPEMLAQINVMRHLYPSLSLEKYESYLQEMTFHNYKQAAVFENEVCVGLTGFWTAIKLWTGKYIEIDNFIVHSDYRSKGIGKLMTDYIDAKASPKVAMLLFWMLSQVILPHTVFIIIKDLNQGDFIL
ncbi:acetyltransferase (GNAT) family protein [Flavobacterium sp. 1]|uniref:GNAT family N-acetyltransferase n=1 Tax=Flavobacterium sp. 1 TaxID=2035200 RepID=UPI000CBCA110|nr:acetyltransferase (GNAT) family protein [Flavobacterium sp. 1]